MMKKFLILSLLVKMIFTTYTSEEEEFLESINFDPTFEQLAISACWLMIIYENADNTENFDRFLNDIINENETISDLTHQVQVYMIKRCHKLITQEQIDQVIRQVDDVNADHLLYKEVVDDFDYTNYPNYLVSENKEKIQGGPYDGQDLDEFILSLIKELEISYNLIYGEDIDFDFNEEEDNELLSDL